RTGRQRRNASRSVDDDRHIRRIGDDVVNRRALLRLRNEGFNLVFLGVGVDLVAHLDAAEAVADVAVDAEDALDIHVAFDGRGDRAQLDIAVLRDGGDAG